MMSMHNIPLTDLEREGLIKHGLSTDSPSQLSDAFRAGMAWALKDKNDGSLVDFKKLSKEELLAIRQYALDNGVIMDICLDAVAAYVSRRYIGGLSKPYADIYAGVYDFLDNREQANK